MDQLEVMAGPRVATGSLAPVLTSWGQRRPGTSTGRRPEPGLARPGTLPASPTTRFVRVLWEKARGSGREGKDKKMIRNITGGKAGVFPPKLKEASSSELWGFVYKLGFGVLPS